MATKTVREKVVAFRLTPEQFKAYDEKLAGDPVIGIRSPGEHARKLALDWCSDQLTWRDKKQRKMASEVALAGQSRRRASNGR